MKKILKLMVAVMVFAVYFVLFCVIAGGDAGDPWDKLMKWAKR